MALLTEKLGLVNVFYREEILEEGNINLIEGNLEYVKETFKIV